MQRENAFIFVCVDTVDCLQHIKTNDVELINRGKVGIYGRIRALFVVKIV